MAVAPGALSAQGGGAPRRDGAALHPREADQVSRPITRIVPKATAS